MKKFGLALTTIGGLIIMSAAFVAHPDPVAGIGAGVAIIGFAIMIFG